MDTHHREKQALCFYHLSGVGVLLDFLSSILHAFKRSDQVGMNQNHFEMNPKMMFSCS